MIFINLLYCGDSNIEDGIFLSALSVRKHTNEDINIFILTANYEKFKAIDNGFSKILKSYLNLNDTVEIIDVTDMFKNYLPDANLSTRFTPLCMLRLLADKIEKIPERILYLDADTLCRKDIIEFYKTKISNYDFCGVPDRYGKWFFGNIFAHNYINSGVLLLNMDLIRKDKLFEKCRKLCRDKKMFMPDQTALNKYGKKKKASRIYNEQASIKNNTVIKHFTTYFKFLPYFKAITIKPWNEEELHNKLKIYEFDDLLLKLKEINKNE